MVRQRRPPSQTWSTFLDNHVGNLVSVDFFTVPTIRFQILYVFLVLAHERRRIVHFAVTRHPTAEWTVQQLREAFPWDSSPRYLLRDRDRIFGQEFVQQVKVMGIKQVLSAPRSPWQRAYVERLIGSIRRECLDHVNCLRRAVTPTGTEDIRCLLSRLANTDDDNDCPDRIFCMDNWSAARPSSSCEREGAPTGLNGSLINQAGDAPCPLWNCKFPRHPQVRGDNAGLNFSRGCNSESGSMRAW
jgi:transposase InsO family protein